MPSPTVPAISEKRNGSLSKRSPVSFTTAVEVPASTEPSALAAWIWSCVDALVSRETRWRIAAVGSSNRMPLGESPPAAGPAPPPHAAARCSVRQATILAPAECHARIVRFTWIGIRHLCPIGEGRSECRGRSGPLATPRLRNGGNSYGVTGVYQVEQRVLHVRWRRDLGGSRSHRNGAPGSATVATLPQG